MVRILKSQVEQTPKQLKIVKQSYANFIEFLNEIRHFKAVIAVKLVRFRFPPPKFGSNAGRNLTRIQLPDPVAPSQVSTSSIFGIGRSKIEASSTRYIACPSKCD